jgi:hypothetical protein
MVENIFGLNLYDLGATATPLGIKKGAIALSEQPGHGVVFDGPALAANEVHGTAAIKRESVISAGL